jgi:hypothetical protein
MEATQAALHAWRAGEVYENRINGEQGGGDGLSALFGDS